MAGRSVGDSAPAEEFSSAKSFAITCLSCHTTFHLSALWAMAVSSPEIEQKECGVCGGVSFEVDPIVLHSFEAEPTSEGPQ